VSANQSVILTATGVNGRTGNATRTITITPKSLPTSSGGQMFSIGQNAAGSPLLLTASVSDPNVNNIGLTFAWSVISSPAGQNLIISKPSDRSTTATFSGPGLYVVRLQATDAAGQVLTETQTFTIGTDGTVAIPPFVTNPSSLTLDVGTRSGLSVLSKNNGSLQWQSSQDGGATWNDIPGANTGYLSIRPTTLAESGRQYRVVTTNAAGSYTSAPATVTVTSPVGGVITFLSSDAVTLQESVGVLNLTIQRLGSTVGATSTTVSIEDSSAVFGEDFLGFDGSEQVTKTLTWADGDGSDRTITIPIVNDAVVEDAEDFLVSLPVPLGSGEFFGEGVFVSINDDDGPGDPALLNSSPTFFESDGTATFQVHRSGGSKGILTATYVAESGINTATPAVAGQDFTAVSGNLTWADGDTADKTISVPLINDGIFEGDETFRVKVSVPQGFPSSASVTLRDAPYQVWQQETWPWAFTSPVPTYTTFASAIRSLNPLFWFRFSETTGTTTAAIDAAGNPVINGALTIRNASGSVGTVQLNQPGPRPAAFPGFEATNTGLVTTAAGAGTSAPTQYVAGGYVTAGSGNGLASKLGDGFTFSAFVRTNVTDRMMNIIGATATAGTQFSVFVNRSFSSSTTVSPHTLRIYVRDNNNDDLDYSVELAGLPTGSLCDGNWHHIAITVPRFTGTDNADFPRFYFDGVEANPLNVRGVEDLPSSPVFPDFLTFGSGVRIAANGAASIAGFFHGSLDEVAFIPTVLSADGIRLLASAGPTSPLPANLAQGADYDGDGLNNLLEYALGLNPLLPNPTPGYHTTVRVNSQDYLAITYTENLASTDVTKRVEVSSDLTNWASGPAATTEVSSSILGTLRTVTVRDNVPLTAGSRRFIRVKVATP
jgi:hypothetical protein